MAKRRFVLGVDLASAVGFFGRLHATAAEWPGINVLQLIEDPFLRWRRSQHAVATVFVLASVLVAACDQTPPTPPATPVISNATDPQWVIQASPRAKVTVVFVHGIFGDTLGHGRTKMGRHSSGC